MFSVSRFVNATTHEKSSRDMTWVLWAQELHAALKKVTSVIDKLVAEKGNEDAEDTKQRLQGISQRLRSAVYKVWTRDDALFEIR